jgi:hypothetical protein
MAIISVAAQHVKNAQALAHEENIGVDVHNTALVLVYFANPATIHHSSARAVPVCQRASAGTIMSWCGRHSVQFQM